MKFALTVTMLFSTVFILNPDFLYSNEVSLVTQDNNQKFASEELKEFNASMFKITEDIKMLRHEDLSTFSAIEMITTGNADTIRKGYTKAINIIRQRIALEDTLHENIQTADLQYNNFSGKYTHQWNKTIRQISRDFEQEVGDAIEELDKQVEKFSKVLNVGKIEVFDYMAKDKVKMIKALKNQSMNTEQLKNNFFDQLKAAIKLSKNVDQTQLLFLEFVVCCMGLQSERQVIEKTMGELNMVNYLDFLQDQSIDAGNISTALDFTFSAYTQGLLTHHIPSHKPDDKLSVEIFPDRGAGGVYKAAAHDKIAFTIKATRDCWFILRARNSRGEVKQLCPNEYYQGENFLKANVPLQIPRDLSYEFEANYPYGLDVVEIIASPQKINYIPEKDTLFAGKYKGLRIVQKQLKERGIDIQQRYKTGALPLSVSYDKAVYDPTAEGNAVIASTFIRVVP